MTKSESKKKVNKMFYTYLSKNFPTYSIELEDGGRTLLIPDSDLADDWIIFHQSRHTLEIDKRYADKKVQMDYDKMKEYLESVIIPFVNNLLDS